MKVASACWLTLYANTQFHQRERELAADGSQEALLEDTRLRLLEDGVDQGDDSSSASAKPMRNGVPSGAMT